MLEKALIISNSNGLFEVLHYFAGIRGTIKLTHTNVLSTGHSCFIRMHAIPQPKKVDRWTEKRSMYGVYDNIGILGECHNHFKLSNLEHFFFFW